MTILYTSTLAFALSATVTWAKSQVCSPDACLEGKSSSSLLAHESSSSRHLTFGTYLESSSPNFEVSEILNISLTSDSLQIDPPLRPIGFPNVNYFGEDETWTDGNWKLEDWQSLYLPTGWYGVLEGGKVIWRGVSDKGELPNDATGLQLVKAASASCDPSCSSHGTCLPSLDGNGGKCTCATGWAGEACDQCATGYWGPSCTGEVSCGSTHHPSRPTKLHRMGRQFIRHRGLYRHCHVFLVKLQVRAWDLHLVHRVYLFGGLDNQLYCLLFSVQRVCRGLLPRLSRELFSLSTGMRQLQPPGRHHGYSSLSLVQRQLVALLCQSSHMHCLSWFLFRWAILRHQVISLPKLLACLHNMYRPDSL
ncbi:hypothetical protein I317_07587 [Kwoniella heveanensis CBS 569]|nr:hypothetical protein I317_07587 [Kwoniella heveanensis CBS 569]